MDNEAFRSFLTSKEGKSSSSSSSNNNKSTKEIAREAVEKEFNEKKKRRTGFRGNKSGGSGGGGGGGGGEREGEEDIYSSDEEYASSRRTSNDRNEDEQDDEEEEEDKKEADNKPSWKRKRSNKSQENKYRDRAKERREGTNTDYNADIHKEGSLVDNEMTKYLGGDEDHTHLVKGLDKTLAEKVRREMKQQANGEQFNDDDDNSRIEEEEEEGNIHSNNTLRQDEQDLDLDDVYSQAKAAKKQIIHHTTRASTTNNNPSNTRTTYTIQELNQIPIEALLQHIQPKIQSSSSLGKSMYTYIQKQHQSQQKPSSTAPIQQQSSILTTPSLSTVHVYNPPNELSSAAKMIHKSTFAFSLYAPIGDRSKAWEMPKETITAGSLSSSSSSSRRRGGGGEQDECVMKPCTPLDMNLIQRIKSVLKKKDVHDDGIDQQDRKKKKKKKTHESTSKKEDHKKEKVMLKTVQEDSDDDDDDIFGDVGEYVPPKTL